MRGSWDGQSLFEDTESCGIRMGSFKGMNSCGFSCKGKGEFNVFSQGIWDLSIETLDLVGEGEQGGGEKTEYNNG